MHISNDDTFLLREKRFTLMKAIWDFLLDEKKIDGCRMKLSLPLVDEVIAHYIEDYRVIKLRYKIPKESHIQLHKIAGLMTASILRYKPIIPLVDDLGEEDRKLELYANEYFAIIHGLSICGEFSLDKIEELINEDWFIRWMNDFLHLLHRRNYTPESLMFIYETLSLLVFPECFEKSE